MERKPTRGFSLIELMIVAAIMAVLAAIVVPGYASYVTRGKRSAAKSALLQLAQSMERYYTANGNYGTTAALPLTSPVSATCVAVAPADGSAANYCLNGTTTVNNGAATAFTLTATPCGDSGTTCPANSNAGYTDADCDVLTIDNTGMKGATGPLGATQCWQR